MKAEPCERNFEYTPASTLLWARDSSSVAKRLAFVVSLAGILASCGRELGPPPATTATSGGSTDSAIRLLIDTVKRDNLYENWRSIECLLFLPDAEDERGCQVEVREQHGGACDGDPNIAPIVDRFRVTREGKIWVFLLKL
jgi:hypothetical protein